MVDFAILQCAIFTKKKKKKRLANKNNLLVKSLIKLKKGEFTINTY